MLVMSPSPVSSSSGQHYATGHHSRDFYFNTSCDRGGFYLAEVQALRQSSLRGGVAAGSGLGNVEEGMRVGFGLYLSASSSLAPVYLHTLHLIPGASPLSVCLRGTGVSNPLTFFFSPLHTSTSLVLKVCQTQLLQLHTLASSASSSSAAEVVLASMDPKFAGGGAAANSALHTASVGCHSAILRDLVAQGRVHASLVQGLEVGVPTVAPTPPCTNQPTSFPTSLPTLAAFNPLNNGSATSLFETTTFISSVTAAGGMLVHMKFMSECFYSMYLRNH